MGSFVKRFWDSTHFGRPGGPYEPYIPDTISEQAFTFSEQTITAIARATEALSRLDARESPLVNTEPLARLIMRSEAVASSRIEGLSVSAKKLMEHEALAEIGASQRLDSTEAAVLANIQIMHEHVSSMPANGTIGIDLLRDINAGLLAGSPLEEHGGVVRTEQNWIGGSSLDPIGAAYIPPTPDAVPQLLEDLVDFCNNSTLPAVAKSAIAHAQFESIHPFADGNGRTGRALTLLLLRTGGLAMHVTPPISMVIASNRAAYIDALNRTRSDIPSELQSARENHIRFFCSACIDACGLMTSFEQRILDIRNEWSLRVAPRRGSAAERLIEVLPGTPVVSIQSAARLIGRSREAARNAINSLVESGVLSQNARNRKSNIYTAEDVLDAFTLFERAAVTRGHDTAQAHPARPVPPRPQPRA